MLLIVSFLKGELFDSNFCEFPCANDCRNYQADIGIKIIKNAPVAPYFSSIYNTLVSIVCGVALGSLLTKFFQNLPANHVLYYWRVVNAFLIITIIWHHYIIHNQFVAWDIGWRDTLIPFGFAGLLMLLVYVVTIKNIVWLSYVFTFLCFGGWFAYYNSTRELRENKKRIIKLYQSVFQDRFAQCLYETIINFEKKAKSYFGILSIFFMIISIIITIYETCIVRGILLFLHTVALIIMINLNLMKEIKKLKCIKCDN